MHTSPIPIRTSMPRPHDPTYALYSETHPHRRWISSPCLTYRGGQISPPRIVTGDSRVVEGGAESMCSVWKDVEGDVDSYADRDLTDHRIMFVFGDQGLEQVGALPDQTPCFANPLKMIARH